MVAAARSASLEEGLEPVPAPEAAAVKSVTFEEPEPSLEAPAGARGPLEEPLLARGKGPRLSTSSKSSALSALSRGRRLRLSAISLPELPLPHILKGGGGSSSSDSPVRRASIPSIHNVASSVAGSSEEAMRYVANMGANMKTWFRNGDLLKKVRPARVSSGGVTCRLDSSLVRDKFHDRKTQLLTGDRHNLEVLGPYAQLHLNIREGRNLLALDANGTSDPYLEVYVNDVQKGRSAYLQKTLDPKWDFKIRLDVWSPFTIVRISVMDWDRFTKDDYIGFVEFRVAEVVPNGPWCSGWCELRLEHMLEGTATHRFRHHRLNRDDHELSRQGSLDQHYSWAADGSMQPRCARDESMSTLNTSPSLITLDTVDTLGPKVVSPTNSRRFRFRPLKTPFNAGQRVKAAICCANVKDGDSADQDMNGKRVNAGEIHISMRLETMAKADEEAQSSVAGSETTGESEQSESKPRKPGGKPQMPSLGRVLLSALLCPSRLLEICTDEEWFACCFPHPTFEAAEDNKEAFSLQDIKAFYEDATQLKAVLQNCVVWPVVSLFVYLVTWRDIALSAFTLSYWLLFCMWPVHLLPTLPLCWAFWLRLLRDHERRNAFFAHESLAPLTEEGLAIIAAMRSSQRMASWLRRVVKDRGGWVDKMASLRQFAKLTHKDGLPTWSFDRLVEDLMSRPWVRSKVMREKRCKEGHVLHFLGMGMYQLTEDGWCCSGSVAGTLDAPCEAEILGRGLHLGVKRYRCPTCCADFCGLCAAGGRALPQVMKVNPAKLPMGGSAMVRAVRDFVLENQDIVDDLQELLEGFLKVVERFLGRQDPGVVSNAYFALGVSSAFLLGAVLLIRGELGFIIYWCATLFGMAVGLALMVQSALPFQRLRTAYRATRDYAKCRELRHKGGCARWAFFTPDEAPEQPGPSVGPWWSEASGKDGADRGARVESVLAD